MANDPQQPVIFWNDTAVKTGIYSDWINGYRSRADYPHPRRAIPHDPWDTEDMTAAKMDYSVGRLSEAEYEKRMALAVRNKELEQHLKWILRTAPITRWFTDKHSWGEFRKAIRSAKTLISRHS